MEIFFHDPDDIPLPREQVRIRELRAEPYPDGHRVRVYLEVTSFQVKPDAELELEDGYGEEVASVSIIETIDPKMELTLHIPPGAGSGEYRLKATLQYRITVPGDGQENPDEPEKYELLIVDRTDVSFSIPVHGES